jgi:hypothetical protein
VAHHHGAFWGGRINGPTAPDVAPVLNVDCARRTVSETSRAAALELARAIADTACARTP